MLFEMSLFFIFEKIKIIFIFIGVHFAFLKSLTIYKNFPFFFGGRGGGRGNLWGIIHKIFIFRKFEGGHMPLLGT